MTEPARVLVVDDEPNLLSGLSRSLGDRFDITTANCGAAALEAIKTQGPFAVVVCDMRMPGMDGIEVLHRIAELAPNTVRIMLTGNADQKTAVEAINRGSIFRFFNKPIPMTALGDGIDAGIEQHRLMTAEKELLEKTLASSVGLLADVLSLVAPEVFQQSRRLRVWAATLAGRMGVKDPWIVEMAAELARLGAIALPPELLARYDAGHPLTQIETEMIGRIPETGANLIRKIPRLEPVAEAVLHQNTWLRDKPPLAARILNLLLNLDEIGKGHASRDALLLLAPQAERFDPDVVAAAFAVLAETTEAREKHTRVKIDIAASDLKIGDFLESDIRLDNGRLVLASGETISEVFFLRLQNVRRMSKLSEPIRVSRTVRH
jgi:response regulator RpfG family c-di-GMP phosphodiesterase